MYKGKRISCPNKYLWMLEKYNPSYTDGRLVFNRKPYDDKLFYRVIWELEYGKILRGYDIHHADENPLNNEFENLKYELHGNHMKNHNSGEKGFWFGKKLSKETLIKMSKNLTGENNGMYNVKEQTF